MKTISFRSSQGNEAQVSAVKLQKIGAFWEVSASLRRLLLMCWLTGLLLGASLHAWAELPEPDNILFGVIAVGSNQITAANTEVIVEARRAIDGPAVASYRMGSDSAAGNFYSLRIPLESLPPVTDTNSSTTGTSLFIVVANSSGTFAQTNFIMGARGQLTRLDFGSIDADGNGLPDDWERFYFGGLGVDPYGDPDGDGQTNLREFQRGANPIVANRHQITEIILQPGGVIRLRVMGRAGHSYGIEATDALGTSATWTLIGGTTAGPSGQFEFEDVDAAYQPARFYRTVERE